jgi:hypothetical protein
MKRTGIFLAVVATALVAGCGGGSSGGGSMAPASVPVPTPTATAVVTATPQEIIMSLPGSTGIGTQTDPVYGAIAGYTEQTFSQVLGFVPGAQIMIVNGQSAAQATPHTLNVLSQTSFPANPTLTQTASGGSTIAAGFQSGTVSAATTIGPFTLTAGLYYIGCGFHYLSNGMRTVLNVAAAATPGPQATPVASQTVSPGQYGY